MKVITAPEEYVKQRDDIFCFLAGGITNCKEWQSAVIGLLEKAFDEDKAHNYIHTHELIVFNPRRPNFPIGDPKAGPAQIAWEYKYLEQSDIFSMYFCADNSDQPICMYELGRNLVRMNEKWGYKAQNVITVEEGYRRENDIYEQLKHTPFNYSLSTIPPEDYSIHVARILRAFHTLETKGDEPWF